jgi:hypothetical protein
LFNCHADRDHLEKTSSAYNIIANLFYSGETVDINNPELLVPYVSDFDFSTVENGNSLDVTNGVWNYYENLLKLVRENLDDKSVEYEMVYKDIRRLRNAMCDIFEYTGEVDKYSEMLIDSISL